VTNAQKALLRSRLASRPGARPGFRLGRRSRLFRSSRLIGAGTVALSLAACGGSPTTGGSAPAGGGAAGPGLSITSPANGATVTGDITVVASVDPSFQLVPAGGSPAANQGHLHVYLDSNYKVNSTNSYTFHGVPNGSHTIKVEAVQNDHSEFSPPDIQTVTVTVSGSATGGSPPPSSAPGGY
jgi:hypothetical protein